VGVACDQAREAEQDQQDPDCGPDNRQYQSCIGVSDGHPDAGQHDIQESADRHKDGMTDDVQPAEDGHMLLHISCVHDDTSAGLSAFSVVVLPGAPRRSMPAPSTTSSSGHALTLLATR
jgi:hypothetical protein